jgi:leader peptidase (prepilin peptidase) / N-methyltransferase
MSEPLIPIAAAVAGALFGLGADRLSVRWPDHLPEYHPRRLDWRTVVVMLTGAVVAAGLATRVDVPRDLAVLTLFAAALMVLLATDLDQKILPDLVTLPLIAFAAAVLLLGWSPVLAGKDFGTLSGVGAAVIAPTVLFISDRVLGGDLGFGDIKLSVSLGLMLGLSALFYGLLVASVGFAIVLVALIALRRIGLRSAVPFGPVLIFAAFIAALAA